MVSQTERTARKPRSDGAEARLRILDSAEELLVAHHFNPGAQRFLDVFAGIYPRCSARRLHNAYQFMLATTRAARSPRSKSRSAGRST